LMRFSSAFSLRSRFSSSASLLISRSSLIAVVLVLAHRLAERFGADLQLPGRKAIVRPTEDRGSFHRSPPGGFHRFW
jgi:hypothetical protein